MFGISDDDLIEHLERIRKSVCCYFTPNFTDMCDCKFLPEDPEARRNSEQTGCCEIRQAITILKGQRDDVLRIDKMLEDSAMRRLGQIKLLVEKPFDE